MNYILLLSNIWVHGVRISQHGPPEVRTSHTGAPAPAKVWVPTPPTLGCMGCAHLSMGRPRCAHLILAPRPLGRAPHPGYTIGVLPRPDELW